MLIKIKSFFMAIAMLFLSIFGISFKHNEAKAMDLYLTNYSAKSGNENTDELKILYKKVQERTPEIRICKEKKPFANDDRIQAIFFDGEKYDGRDTEIFAYIGFPENASEDKPVPAMVLVHGGAGHAYADWVQYWVNNGYAAISVDGFGQIPPDGNYTEKNELWSVNPASHPTIDELRSADKPFEQQWFYHYVADVMLSNNIMRADSRVITDKIGVTGISWGSMATSVAICYDNRFAFAIPVYGSGFLEESTAAIGSVTHGKDYIEKWEPSHLLGEVEMPVFYVNSDSDPFFSANCTTASAAYTKNGDLVFAQDFAHGQRPGSEQPEILRFANEQTGMGEGNIKITKASFDGKRALVSFDAPEDVENIKAYVYYRTGELEYNGLEIKEKWHSKKGIVLGTTANIKVPEKAKYFYISVQGKSGKLFNKETVQATTGIYSAYELKKDGLYSKELDTDKLQKNIDKRVNKDLKQEKISGCEILVNQNGQRVFDKTFGKSFVGGEDMQKNQVYRIASMTKPVTAVAMLIEYERGHLDIYADVSDYLDGFEDMYVGKMVDGKPVADHKAKNSVKVYQLVSHTSGIASGEVGEYVFNHAYASGATLDNTVSKMSTGLLSFDPGTAQEYSTGAFDVCAKIIEVVSGMTFQEYIKVNIFDKLGMTDTTFKPNDEQWSRMVGVFGRTEDGKGFNEKTNPGCVFGGFSVDYPLAGGGLASTPEDYMKFAEMLLNFGKAADGTQILSEETVELMRTPVVGDDIMPGFQKWGLGVRVITEDSVLPVGTFGWSGAYGTHFWVDPANQITAVYMKNASYEGGAGARTANNLEEDVYDALMK